MAECIRGVSGFIVTTIGYIDFFFSSRRRHTRYWRDWSSDVCSSDLTACAYLSIFTTIGIVVVLFEETVRFFLDVSVWEFLTSTRWVPTRGEFGVLPLV